MSPRAVSASKASSVSAAYAARIALLNDSTQFVEKDQFVRLLDASMAEDALHTLRLVAYIRDHHAGKGSTLHGYFALERLAVTHPRELVHNLRLFVGVFGRFDDTAALMDTPVEKGALALLARQLEEDLAVLKQSDQAADEQQQHCFESPRISMCAKWIPSQQKSLERDTQLNKKLSRYMKISPATLRKVYLSPLRAKLQLFERLMCSKQWDAIDLDAVPSVAMQRLGKPRRALECHLGDKFTAWNHSRAKGETTKRAEWKMPIHKIVAGYLDGPACTEPDAILEKQWKLAVEEARQVGSLRDTIVLPDLGRNGTERLSIALWLLASSSASTDVFKNRVLTFISRPQFRDVTGETLHARVRSLLEAPRYPFVDCAVAQRAVLRVAIDEKLEKHQMPTTLLVVSDMVFSWVDSKYESNYATLEREFADAGYEVPRLVFWHVANVFEEALEYTGQAKVTLVSGFSAAILRRVLAGKVISPQQTVLDIVDDERYAAIALPPIRTAQAAKQKPQGKW